MKRIFFAMAAAILLSGCATSTADKPLSCTTDSERAFPLDDWAWWK